jgi:predicted metal-dependent hydrolase
MTNPTLVITGTPAWAQTLQSQLGASYSIKRYTERAPGYVARLTDDHAALIVVDGADAGWRFWTTTPKASPATRRIPVLVIAASRDVRSSAIMAGADLTLTPEDIPAGIEPLVRENARVLSPELIEQLDCECDEPLPPLAVQGVHKFNAGEYYPQHDLFEEQWRSTEGPVRNLYQAVLQVGVAYYQITRGNYRGALKMLLRSVQWIAMLPDVCQGIDVKQLREDSYRVRAELERMNPEDIAHFDRSLLKPVIWHGSP